MHSIRNELNASESFTRKWLVLWLCEFHLNKKCFLKKITPMTLVCKSEEWVGMEEPRGGAGWKETPSVWFGRLVTLETPIEHPGETVKCTQGCVRAFQGRRWRDLEIFSRQRDWADAKFLLPGRTGQEELLRCYRKANNSRCHTSKFVE